MNFNEVKKYIEENTNSDEVRDYIRGLITPDRVENFLSSDEGKKLLQPKLDSYATKAIASHDEKFKTNELPKLINEAIAKANPKETPEQKQIRELTERIEKAEKEKTHETLRNKALKIVSDKKLPDLVDFFIGSDENSTIENLNKFEEIFSKQVDVAVKERLGNGYVPPKDDKQTKTNTTNDFVNIIKENQAKR